MSDYLQLIALAWIIPAGAYCAATAHDSSWLPWSLMVLSMSAEAVVVGVRVFGGEE